ncbi:MAG: hypothetical protein LUI09_05710 [Prevotellaceae bacterium]|nr:hypothetical protein [Prevotellaceae bacterium]
MSPEYFHERLTYSEAADFLDGLARRYRGDWEQARLIADVTARCAGNKQGVRLEFPWEKEEKLRAQAPPTKAEMEDIRRLSRRIKAMHK